MTLPVAGAHWPVGGRGAFGYRRSSSHTHRGVDLAAPLGTPVVSVSRGVVVVVVEPGTPGFRGYGRAVVVQDASRAVWWLYAHLHGVKVRVGQAVLAGDPIGDVGRSCDAPGNPQAQCSGAHLHLEASSRPYPQHSEAARIDPSTLLGVSAMSTPTNASRFRNLAGLIDRLVAAVPPRARATAEWQEAEALLSEWRRAFELSQSGWGLADSALAYWVDQYNTLRGQLTALGVPGVPPAVRRDPTWQESVSDTATSIGRGVGLVALAVVAVMLLRKD